MTGYESSIDRQIREAQERGAFDNLPGAGKPLSLGPQNDPDWWIKGLVKRENISGRDLLPPGLALRRELEDLPGQLRELRSERAVRSMVEDLNARIDEARRRPSTGGPPVTVNALDVDEVVRDWREHLGAP